MSDTHAVKANTPPVRNRYGEMCAEVYVLDKPPGSLGDIDYYRDHLSGLEGPFLEAACGSGRLLIPMLEAGLPIEGFDRSPAMLARCRAAAAERGLAAGLAQMSYEDFGYSKLFGAIVCPVGAFTLIEDYEVALAVLRRFHAHLRPGGRLFIDLMPLSYLNLPADFVRSWTTPEGDLLRIDSRRVELDFLAQLRVSHDRYERWRDGRLVEEELEVLATRVWSLKEFELTLKAAGFGDVSVCGDYRNGRAPRPGDRQWCFQAVRL